MNEDVINHILEFIYFLPSRQPNHRQLATCARISRVWRYPSQRLLFHHIRIDDESSWNIITKLFHPKTRKPQRKEVLRRMVHILEFPRTGRREEFRRQWESRLPVIMQLLPSLYELRLDVIEVEKLNPTTLLALESTPSIHALVITMHESSLRFANPSVVPLQLLRIQAWKLRFLALKGSSFSYSDELITGVAHHELYSLEVASVITNRAFPNIPPEALLAWLLSDSQNSLRRLSLWTAHTSLLPFLANLHSFSYRTADLDLVETKGESWTNKLSSLKELIRPNAHIRASGRYFKEVPPSVSHLMLAVHIVEWTDKHLLEYLDAISPNIRVLSLIVSQEIWRPSALVMDAYAAKNIQIRIVFGGRYVFNDGVMEVDRIESTVYPVGKSLRTVGAMALAVRDRLVIEDNKGNSWWNKLL